MAKFCPTCGAHESPGEERPRADLAEIADRLEAGMVGPAVKVIVVREAVAALRSLRAPREVEEVVRAARQVIDANWIAHSPGTVGERLANALSRLSSSSGEAPERGDGEEGAESKTCERCGYVGGGGWLPGWDTDPTAGTQPRGMKCPDCNPAPAAAESTRAAKVDVEIIRGVEGLCVAVNGTRIAGAKPWGEGKVVASWEVDADDIRGSLPAAAPREVEGGK